MKQLISAIFITLTFSCLQAEETRFSIPMKALKLSIIDKTEPKLEKYIESLKALSSKAKLNTKQKEQKKTLTLILKKYQFAKELHSHYTECQRYEMTKRRAKNNKEILSAKIAIMKKSNEVRALFKKYPEVVKDPLIRKILNNRIPAVEEELE